MYKIVRLFLCSACLLTLTVLWLSSYTHYTSLGIDHDLEHENQTLHVFARIRWTGHGSIWMGYGSVWREADATAKLEKFDVAAVFFRRMNKPLDISLFWNRLGFWFISAVEPRPTFWVGIPSWLPVLLVGGLLIWLFRNQTNSLKRSP